MKCPICNDSMKQVRQDSSFNPKDNDKEYVRTVYKCEKDDAWLTTELPKLSGSQKSK